MCKFNSSEIGIIEFECELAEDSGSGQIELFMSQVVMSGSVTVTVFKRGAYLISRHDRRRSFSKRNKVPT